MDETNGDVFGIALSAMDFYCSSGVFSLGFGAY